MPQLGSGLNSGFPQVIDTKQLFENGTPAAPDDATRIDKEVINDTLDAILKLEHTLGANVQGVYGSLAARLQQHIPGGSVTLSSFAFAEQHVWTIPGTTHHLGADAFLVQVYDTATPAIVLQPESVTIATDTYDVVVTFATSQSGRVVLGGGAPLFTMAFTNEITMTIAAAVHTLGTAYFFVSLFTLDEPLHILTPASIVIDPVTTDVTITFLLPTSGTLILSAMGPRHVAPFTSATTVTVPGSAHLLQSNALLLQLFDATGAVIEANSVTVHPSTYDVTLTFLVAQSGAALLARAVDITGRDFLMQDGGIPESTAVRFYSANGGLNLQMGEGNYVAFRNRLGGTVALMNQLGALGLGTLNPAYQLHLTTDSAAKPATSTWTVASDERLKEVLGPFTDSLETLLALEPLRYRYNGLGGMPDDRREHIGFLAQAVQAVAPYMVQSYRGRLTPEGAETDILTLNIDALHYLLTNAVKELLDLNTALTARVDALEVAVATLQGAQP